MLGTLLFAANEAKEAAISGIEIFFFISSIVLILAAITLIVIVLIQSNHAKGLSGTIAGGQETFYGKNKGNSLEKKLMIVTIVVASVFVLLAVTVFAFQKIPSYIDYLINMWQH